MTLAVNHDEQIIRFLTVSFERMTGLGLVLLLHRGFIVSVLVLAMMVFLDDYKLNFLQNKLLFFNYFTFNLLASSLHSSIQYNS